MTPPKYSIGTRVEILTRRNTPDRKLVWENSCVGSEAIILSVREWDKIGYGDVDLTQPGYELFIFERGDINPHPCCTFEERFLELVCCNVDKGMALIEKYRKCV